MTSFTVGHGAGCGSMFLPAPRCPPAPTSVHISISIFVGKVSVLTPSQNLKNHPPFFIILLPEQLDSYPCTVS